MRGMAKVLIVEDEIPILLLIEAALQQAGYETLTASSLGDAKSVLGSTEKLDVVFTDIALGKDADGGIEIGLLTKRTRPGVPVIYATARGADSMRGLSIEPSVHLQKPYTEDQLVKAVQRLLAKSHLR